MKIKTKTLVNALNQIDFDKKAIHEYFNLLFLNTIENKLSLNYTHHFEGTSINILVDCEVASDMNIAVDIQEFIKLVKTIKSDTIVLSIDYDNLKINNYSILIFKDYALTTSFEKEYTKILEMPSNQFVKMLNQVKPAMSKDKARQNIKSININSKNNKLNLVSTDGHCMIIKTQDIYTQEINEIIPDIAVKQIIKAFKSDELLIISLNKTNTISFLKIESNNTTLFLRLVDAEYPDYTRFFIGNEIVKVNKNELITTTQEALAITTDKNNSMIFNFENNILEIKVKKQDQIKYINQMTIEGLVKLETGFNARLLLNILKSIDDDIIILKLRDSNSVMQIEADNFTGLIMPIRI